MLKLEPEITRPNPVRARQMFLKPDLGPKAGFTEWVKISPTCGGNYLWINNSFLIIFYWKLFNSITATANDDKSVRRWERI